ncbi:MAG TPA: hypothetical protein VHE14_05705 [Solirubrobacteraceae bacterium]|nr:hypothetical protein [Solirubrobacteraceae bacterium]
MTAVGATVVDWGQLLKVVWTAAAAGVGVTLVFSLAVLGASRCFEHQRSNQPLGAFAFGLLALAGLGVCGAAIVAGIIVLAQK